MGIHVTTCIGTATADTVHVTTAPDGSLTIVPTGGAAQWGIAADGQLSAMALGTKPESADTPTPKNAGVFLEQGPSMLAVAITNSGPSQLSEANDRSYGPPLTDTLSGWTSTGPPAYAVVENGTAALVQRGAGWFERISTLPHRSRQRACLRVCGYQGL